jgi:hypothetical protein
MKPLLFTSRADVSKEIDRCRLRINQCADVIKQLSGVTPDRFSFSFCIGEQEIVKFEIAEDESEFQLAYFMSWHSFYSKRLAVIEKLL